jgi:hypothetical protein
MIKKSDAGALYGVETIVGWLRCSPHFYNTEQQMDRLVEALPPHRMTRRRAPKSGLRASFTQGYS